MLSVVGTAFLMIGVPLSNHVAGERNSSPALTKDCRTLEAVMSRTNTSSETEASAPLSSLRKRAAELLIAAALGAGWLAPGVASANPSAPTIFPGECPSPPGSWRVACIQWVLDKYTGHEMGGPPYDGCFGPVTRAAVGDFQRFFGLADDGQIGQRTGQAFDDYMAVKSGFMDYLWWYQYCLPHIPTLE
jgi:hypothetical protein